MHTFLKTMDGMLVSCYSQLSYIYRSPLISSPFPGLLNQATTIAATFALASSGLLLWLVGLWTNLYGLICRSTTTVSWAFFFCFLQITIRVDPGYILC